MTTRIRYGIRRFRMLVGVFTTLASILTFWAARIEQETFVFPLGRLPAPMAKAALFGVAGLALSYVALVAYTRFVRKPSIVIEKTSLTLPIGEFGFRSLVLRKGDVLALEDYRRARWLAVHVTHGAGNTTFWSNFVPTDAEFYKVRKKLAALSRRPM